MKTKLVYAEYNRYGYTVFVDGEPVYGAGNNPCESASVLTGKMRKAGENLSTLKRFAISTAKDIADEIKGKYTGVERVGGYYAGSRVPHTPDCLGAAYPN